MLYTGSSYYCGLSALKTGVDSVHLFCDAAAASVIRHYTSEMVIHPVLDQEYGMEEVDVWLPRMDCVVVGPGLGKNQSMLGRISLVLQKIVALNIPVIVDGDGLWHIVHQPSTLTGYSKAMITPNNVELGYLHKTFCSHFTPSTDVETCKELAQSLGNITIITKGVRDIITNGNVTISCNCQGSPRRCDGQGHILSGIAAAFLFWSISTSKSPHIIETQENFSKYINATDNRKLNSIVAFDDGMVSNDAIVRAGWAACHLTRSSAYKAFSVNGRATSAQDIIDCIGPTFRNIYDGGTPI